MEPSPRTTPDPSPRATHYIRVRFCVNYTRNVIYIIGKIMIKTHVIKIYTLLYQTDQAANRFNN
jgi:hypothetical protein